MLDFAGKHRVSECAAFVLVQLCRSAGPVYVHVNVKSRLFDQSGHVGVRLYRKKEDYLILEVLSAFGLTL